jgi:hypothetical protein
MPHQSTQVKYPEEEVGCDLRSLIRFAETRQDRTLNASTWRIILRAAEWTLTILLLSYFVSSIWSPSSPFLFTTPFLILNSLVFFGFFRMIGKELARWEKVAQNSWNVAAHLLQVAAPDVLNDESLPPLFRAEFSLRVKALELPQNRLIDPICLDPRAISLFSGKHPVNRP